MPPSRGARPRVCVCALVDTRVSTRSPPGPSGWRSAPAVARTVCATWSRVRCTRSARRRKPRRWERARRHFGGALREAGREPRQFKVRNSVRPLAALAILCSSVERADSRRRATLPVARRALWLARSACRAGASCATLSLARRTSTRETRALHPPGGGLGARPLSLGVRLQRQAPVPPRRANRSSLAGRDGQSSRWLSTRVVGALVRAAHQVLLRVVQRLPFVRSRKAYVAHTRAHA